MASGRAATSVGLPFALFSAWRLQRFGALLPNSVACKAGAGEAPFTLVIDMALVFGWAPPLAIYHLRRGGGPSALILTLPAALYAAILVGVDPVLGYYNRHALTACALLSVPACAGAVTLLARVGRGCTRARWEACLAAAGALVLALSLPSQARSLSGLSDLYLPRIEARADLSRWLAEHLGPEDSFVIGAAGRIAYDAAARPLDAFCLNYPPAARPPLSDDPAALAAHLLALEPAALVVSSASSLRLMPLGYRGVFPAMVEAEAFARDYRLSHVASADPGFGYFVYTRRSSP